MAFRFPARGFRFRASDGAESEHANQPLETAGLVQIDDCADDSQAPAGRQKSSENQRPEQANSQRPARAGLDFSASGLDQAAILHAGRAGGFASAAGQTKLDVLDVGRADGRAVGDLRHLIDPAARRIHFNAQFAIGGTGVQTQAAVDAAVEVDELRFVRNFRYGHKACHDSAGRGDRTSA